MATENEVVSEIEVLQSIYLDELKVTQKDDDGWEVSLVLYPSTAADSLSQFVRLTLTLTLDSQYPSSPPSISIHNPRGLSDDKLLSVQKCLKTEAESSLGTPVLYQLIERAKEILTESNIPHGNCVICLYGFKEGEVFTKTSCYHYFHSHCLGRYITHSEKELREREREMEEDKTRERAEGEELTVVCPVCREPLTYDVETLLSAPAPSFPKMEEAGVGADFKQKWVELQKILERQRESGGIIDPEAESNRFLIHINEPQPSSSDVPCNTSDAPSSQSLPSPPATSTNQNPTSQGPYVSSQSQRRGGYSKSRQGEFKRGRRGKGGQVPCETLPAVVDNVEKLHLSSEKFKDVKKATGEQQDLQAENTLEGHAVEQKCRDDAEISESLKMQCGQTLDANQQDSIVTIDGQQISQSDVESRKTNGQTNSVNRGHRRGHQDRGRRHGQHGSGYSQEKNFREPNQWNPSGFVYHHRGGRGHRARGGGASYPHTRGGRANRGSGRGFHPRVESEREEGVL
ncbi:E3 ubiquitin-protein ligase RNF25 [Chanos chanos]|uniref:E3 ubiquitin-protein ligase RNF25 n=1 Tax=Chanos chanos TaxID=29144 RepID=A0A6J2WXR2_CHACN|nr:E3 ubiquitin-protein ligase RNF25 [Chanos chanos]